MNGSANNFVIDCMQTILIQKQWHILIKKESGIIFPSSVSSGLSSKPGTAEACTFRC